MKLVRKLDEIREESPCALALGAFDGLHLGHRAVIRAALKEAAAGSMEAGVFTFDASPSGAPAVLTQEDKEALLEDMGVQRIYAMEFSSLGDMEAEEFFRHVLLEKCRAKVLCCGEDFRFGKGAKGDVSLLQKLCGEAGAALTVIPPVLGAGEKVSSTRIRQLLEQGDVPAANRLLGRPFGFALEVVHGNHIGTGLGTPTINQAMPEGLVLPPFGVYAPWAQVGEQYFYGVTNIGVKPTVGSNRVLSETWMPEFSGDLYGRKVRLFLLEFLRPERKFSSLEELREEIRRDAVRAKRAAKDCPPPGFGL